MSVEPPHIICGIDPGETTGFVLMCLTSTKGDYDVIKAFEIPWGRRFELRNLLHKYLPDVLVIESFRLYEHKAKDQIGSDFPSVRVIGITEAYMYELDCLKAITYQPAHVTARVQVLARHVGVIGSSEHVKDAYKHLRYYLVTKHRMLME
jgi:hypothetical protein